MTYRFSIERLPSVELTKNSGDRWTPARRRRFFKMDRDDARAYFLQAYAKPKKPLTRAKVTTTSYVKVRRVRDADNWTARMAGMMDGLKGLVFEDDSFECIGKPDHNVVVDKDKAGREGLVEFVIEEA